MKTRTYCGIWYPHEDPSHLFALQKVKTQGYPFLAIDHDRDRYTSEETDDHEKLGTLKKNHTHILIQFASPRSYDAVVKELNIAHNYLQPCRDTKGYMLYMLHDGFDDKAQYDLSDCYGPLVAQLQKYLADDSEGTRVMALLALLDTMPRPCSYRKFLYACCESDLYSEFRRLGFGITRLLEEHNGAGYN